MTEYEIQCSIVKWFRITYKDGIIFSVPNEAGWRNSNRYIASGMLSGVSDLVVIMKNKVIFFEVKTKQGKQSMEQLNYQQQVESLGFQYYVVRSLDEFIYRIKHAYGPYGPDGRPMDYKDWQQNLEDALPKSRRQIKTEKKIIKQNVEMAVIEKI